MINSKKMYFVNLMMQIFPNAGLQKIKASLFRWAGVEIGQNVELFQNIKVYGNGRLVIGDGCFVGQDVNFLIDKNGSILLENSIAVSAKVIMSTGFHPITPYGERIVSRQGTCGNIVLKKGCAVLTGAIVLPNVTIGENALVAAGAVVNKNVDSRTLVGGVPAKFIRSYETKQ